MPETCETMKVENKDHESGYMIINVSDFDPVVHKAYSEKSEPAKSQPKRQVEGDK